VRNVRVPPFAVAALSPPLPAAFWVAICAAFRVAVRVAFQVALLAFQVAFLDALFAAALLSETAAFGTAASKPFFLLDRAMMSPYGFPSVRFLNHVKPNGNSDTILDVVQARRARLVEFAFGIKFVNG
jgi:hypothetical protein